MLSSPSFLCVSVSLFIQPTLQQLLYKDLMGDSVKDFVIVSPGRQYLVLPHHPLGSSFLYRSFSGQ